MPIGPLLLSITSGNCPGRYWRLICPLQGEPSEKYLQNLFHDRNISVTHYCKVLADYTNWAQPTGPRRKAGFCTKAKQPGHDAAWTRRQLLAALLECWVPSAGKREGRRSHGQSAGMKDEGLWGDGGRITPFYLLHLHERALLSICIYFCNKKMI